MARGFFAELNRAAKAAARERERANREAVRRHNAAVREAESAKKAEARATAQLARANEAERKRMEKEAKGFHIASMEAETERRNHELAEIYDEIDSLLAATLGVDDYADLGSLRTAVEHPRFDRTDLEKPIPIPLPIPRPLEPSLNSPPPPKGLGALLGKKKYQKAVARAADDYKRAVAGWQSKVMKLKAAQDAAKNEHAQKEAERLALLAKERSRYEQECFERELKVQEHNEAIDTLIANLGYGDTGAVEEYVSIVLSNSIYPPHFQVEHDFQFDAASAELWLKVAVPSPDTLPTTKGYKYNKTRDEITLTALSRKACKDRYATAVNEVALRSIHEVFEADRRGLIKTIALEVGTKTANPATGLPGFILFVATGAEREAFLKMDLSNVVSSATLEHLGASVSKNPYDLVAADASGVRRS